MKDGNVIEVKNLKKKFKVFYDKGNSLKEKILFKKRNRYEERWVLNGINFEIKKGEAVGLIGRNGCGKSTTLKILSRILYPTEGTVEIVGRVSSLLELGAGFHPDMSGRENIYTNASIFGLTRKEIDERLEDIIEFSELREFIDNPVRTYSSGMYMRLAFSVAINVDADILLIDEILAVGDISFQTKCFEKLKEIKRNGTTIIIVSHSFEQIEKICERSIWIEKGRIEKEGEPKKVHVKYLEKMGNQQKDNFQDKIYNQLNNEQKNVKMDNIPKEVSDYNLKSMSLDLNYNLLELENKDKIEVGNNLVKFKKLFLLNQENKECLVFHTGDDIKIIIYYESFQKDLKGTLGIEIYTEDNIYCYGTNTFIELNRIMDILDEEIVIITLNKIPLLAGEYYLNIGIHDELAMPYMNVISAIKFKIFDTKGDMGISRIETTWKWRNMEER